MTNIGDLLGNAANELLQSNINQSSVRILTKVKSLIQSY